MSARGGAGAARPPDVERVRRTLRVLAELDRSAPQPEDGRLAVPVDWFRWLPLNALSLLAAPLYPLTSTAAAHGRRRISIGGTEVDERRFGIERSVAEQLAAVDALRPWQSSLRVGWLFFSGQVERAGRTTQVLRPLAELPVRVVRVPLGPHWLVPAGDVRVSDLVNDPSTRRSLGARVPLGGGALAGASVEVPRPLLPRLHRLGAWTRDVLEAAALPAAPLEPVELGPERLLQSPAPRVVVGLAVYAADTPDVAGGAAALTTWAGLPLEQQTAFHHLYVEPPEGDEPLVAPPGGETVDSPYPLSDPQREAVRSSRHEPVTVVSGAPGTGKSHTIAAIAGDALERGERVLVATRSEAGVDALLAILRSAPGPDPVVFGSNEHRDALGDRLADGLEPASAQQLTEASEALAAIRDHRDRLRGALRARVASWYPERPSDGAGSLPAWSRDPAVDLEVVDDLVREATAEGRGWRRERRRARAERELRELLRMGAEQPIAGLGAAVTGVRTLRLADAGHDRPDGPPTADWEELGRLEAELRRSLGRARSLEAHSEARLNRRTLPAVAALSTALRAGRAARRAELARLDDPGLTTALPLWLGTLDDIDDLLPLVPALFDLVVLDEASGIGQPSAASALLRARRAVIVGDPRQLRHTTTLTASEVDEALALHLPDLSPSAMSRLDVRRNSIFDVAAGAAPVRVLDEQHRSLPHLVQFVAERIYRGRLHLTTWTPLTERHDCIRVIRLDSHGPGPEKAGGPAEVAEVVRQVRTLVREGARSVGVISPRPEHAAALERSVLGAVDLDHIEALDLRIGSVPAFQGVERDTMIVSLGLGSSPSPAEWRVVDDPHLFTVLTTRARRHLIVCLTAPPPDRGLFADFLAQADDPPAGPALVPTGEAWVGELAEDLRLAEVPVRVGYPVGRDVIDLVIGDASRYVAVVAQPHGGGPDAHVERHLALRRLGWTVWEVPAARWADHRAELVVRMVEGLAGGPAPVETFPDS